MRRTALRLRTMTVATALAAVAVPIVVLAAPAQAATSLVGTFRLTPGSCSSGTATGTYLRMILPSGSAAGPFMSNSDSSCHDQSYTPLAPGADGGLVTGGYQAPPSPAFDSAGNAQARRITAPAQFYGTAFATGTTPVDAQTHTSVPAPTVTVSGSRLSADLRAFSVTWNNQYFNQGAPKPDGTYPGNTHAATGTYDSSTGAFTLQWTSQVVGGPFDKFTGLWHLQGHFVASGGAGARSGGTTVGQGAAQGAGSGAVGATGGPTASVPGARITTGTAAAHPSAGAAVPVAANGSVDASPVASTRTVIRDGWRAQWWLIALAVVIAVVGFGALFVLNRSIGRGVR